MCNEFDLRKLLPAHTWIGLYDGFKQPLIYDNLPKYYISCHVQGHISGDCRRQNADGLAHTVDEQYLALNFHPQAVRHNAKVTIRQNQTHAPTQIQVQPSCPLHQDHLNAGNSLKKNHVEAHQAPPNVTNSTKVRQHAATIHQSSSVPPPLPTPQSMLWLPPSPTTPHKPGPKPHGKTVMFSVGPSK